MQRVLIAVNKSAQSKVYSLDITGTDLQDAHSASARVGGSDSVLLNGPILTLHLAPESALIATVE